MPIRDSSAVWTGTLLEGSGTMSLGGGAYQGAYTRASRFAEGSGTNPEELLGAAHAGCYSMFLASLLSKAGFIPTRIRTTARVHLGDGPTIRLIELETLADVPGIDAATFAEHAEKAKKNCPVSKALAAVEITLNAVLKQDTTAKVFAG